jgi:8-oxo-dGTP pyrophosphatase MutT (NUDIX family)
MTEQVDGRKFGAYGMVLAPEGIIFIEKPGKGRGLEFPGGHGEPEDDSLEECFERELDEETGVHVAPEDMRLIDEPRVLPTHTSGIFLAQISRLPKTLKKQNADETGRITEVVHILTLKEVRAMRSKIFPPHLRYLDMALKMLDTSRCERD